MNLIQGAVTQLSLPTFDTILSAKKLPGLDGFRMIAVLAAMVSHAGFSSFFSARHGVAGFFVLSGFLITWLLLKEHEKEGRISLNEKAKFRLISDRLSQHFWMPLVTLALLALSRSTENPDYEYGPAFTIDAALLAVLLIQVMRLSHGRVWGWLNSRPIVFLGVISYPTYLWHGWGLQAGGKVPQVSAELALLLGIIFSYGLACGSYFVIEKRSQRLKRRFEKSGVQK